MNRKGQKVSGIENFVITVFLALALFVVTVTPAIAADAEEAQGIVDKARVTFNNFMRDKNYTWLHSHLKDAKGLLILPHPSNSEVIPQLQSVQKASVQKETLPLILFLLLNPKASMPALTLKALL